AAGIESRQNVLGGGEQHALFHQAGGVADARHVSNMRFNLKIVEVHPPEHDSSIGLGRHEPQVRFYGRMQADTLRSDRPLDSSLIAQVPSIVASLSPSEIMFRLLESISCGVSITGCVVKWTQNAWFAV